MDSYQFNRRDFGRGLGGSILGMLGAPNMAGMAGDAAGMDTAALLGQVASGVGSVGRGVLLAIVGFVRLKIG